LVRRARTEGPQRVTVHGKETVVVASVEDYAKSRQEDTRTGADLIPIMQKGRMLGLKLRPFRYYPRVKPPIDFSDGGQ
jgi:prevent-host-death family protein